MHLPSHEPPPPFLNPLIYDERGARRGGFKRGGTLLPPPLFQIPPSSAPTWLACAAMQTKAATCVGGGREGEREGGREGRRDCMVRRCGGSPGLVLQRVLWVGWVHKQDDY
nr:hypothetical protein [Morchella crassipes]